jgi:ubiquinone/menaquinone biosynthesis C-methylase UbiE
MADKVCPAWVGYLLLNPLRKLWENPDRMLAALVRPGMTVLEPGCGAGYFTLPLAKMVGPQGKVIAIDVQSKMLDVLARRARENGLAERIERRKAQTGSLDIQDLEGRIDFVAAIHVVHEMPDPGAFFRQVWSASKPGGRMLLVEPRRHVTAGQWEQTLSAARLAGFQTDERYSDAKKKKVLLCKPD